MVEGEDKGRGYGAPFNEKGGFPILMFNRDAIEGY